MKDFSFQGRIELASRLSDGTPGDFVWVGDQSSCELSFNTETADRTETYSGQRLQSARLRTGTTVSGSLVLRYFTPENIQLGLYSTQQNVAGATITGEVITGSAAGSLGVGKRFALAKPFGVTAVAIKDSASTPVTLLTNQVDPADNDYIIEPGTFIIKQLKTGSPAFTAPLTADYTHVAFTSLPMFTADPPERWFKLFGMNTTTGERVTVDLYRMQFNPFSSIPLINEEFGELTLEFTALFDSEKALDSTLGGFGRIQMAA